VAAVPEFVYRVSLDWRGWGDFLDNGQGWSEWDDIETQAFKEMSETILDTGNGVRDLHGLIKKAVASYAAIFAQVAEASQRVSLKPPASIMVIKNSPVHVMSIFVSIASYRDELCNHTLQDLFEKANRPESISVGICQQNDEHDTDCLLDSDPRVRVIHMPHQEARGPCYARYLCSTLFQDEDFFLQIDAHTIFTPGWDDRLRQMISGLPPRSVLSHYPQPFDAEHPDTMPEDHGTVPSNCRAELNDKGIPSFRAFELPRTGVPRKTMGIAGGMLFMPGGALRECPMDPDLDFLFTGEEVLYGARLYTRGWDIYSPSEPVLYHFYTREGAPKFWDEPVILERARAASSPEDKVKRILGLDGGVPVVGMYGLGWTRPVTWYLDSLDTC
jgi:hypothetical protein